MHLNRTISIFLVQTFLVSSYLLVLLLRADQGRLSVRAITYTGPPTPPATYYGLVSGAPGFTPIAGMIVTASINNTLCGQDETYEYQDNILYAIDVSAAGSGDLAGCGTSGVEVVIRIENQVMFPTLRWDHNQLNEVALTPMFQPAIPLLHIAQYEDSIQLTWQQPGYDIHGNETVIGHYEVWRATTPYFFIGESDCHCTLIVETEQPGFIDQGEDGATVIGDIDQNYFYAVRAVNATGPSKLSDIGGEFDFPLESGQ
ncbi:MAG: hypothetical protein GY759_10495 [Chloroflexi bacterium]|nr:hypothetical protein [Chloroflexota bacterium]